MFKWYITENFSLKALKIAVLNIRVYTVLHTFLIRSSSVGNLYSTTIEIQYAFVLITIKTKEKLRNFQY